jgi:hypothetical protein
VLAVQFLQGSAQALRDYAAALKQRSHGRGLRALKRLQDLQRTYPPEPFVAAVTEALHFGLFDLGRLETLILRHVAGDFFALATEPDDDA